MLFRSANTGKALRENACFVYLGSKQDTETEVKGFLENRHYSVQDVELVSELASAICLAESCDDLCYLTEKHENILSSILKRDPVIRRFPTFPGTAKSLGAWGGDFAMFVSGEEPVQVAEILHGLGFPVVFSYKDIKALS